ncbi:hypothetical protein FRC03_008834 [Tulasnella sp. 419]|nr:hypothetical protein FRC03_008834 [Tulasnella sp. 419]
MLSQHLASLFSSRKKTSSLFVFPDPPKPASPGEPAPVAVHKIDFATVGLPEYAGKYALVLDNVFTAEDCAKLLKHAESNGQWESAKINGGPTEAQQYLDTSYRNSQRIMVDDVEMAEWTLSKLRPYLKDIEYASNSLNTLVAKRGEKVEGRASLVGLNERFRFLKYGPGNFFKQHSDGLYYTPDRKRVSIYTLQIYLNGDPDALEGGATRFWTRKISKPATDLLYVDVEARMGRVLIFEQAGLVRSGEEVIKGEKISMRTDLMYECLVSDEDSQMEVDGEGGR